MPRNYQPKTTGYSLPHNVYMQVKYIIKDYHHMLRERDNILHSSPEPGSCSGGPGDATGNKAVRLSMLSERVDAIDRAIHDVSAVYANRIKRGDESYFDCMEAYQDYGYFCYIMYEPGEGKEPSYMTWRRFKGMLSYFVAKNLNFL